MAPHGPSTSQKSLFTKEMLVGAVGIESTHWMNIKEFCGAAWSSKELKVMRGNFTCPLNAPKKFALLSSSLNIYDPNSHVQWPPIRSTHCRTQARLSVLTLDGRTDNFRLARHSGGIKRSASPRRTPGTAPSVLIRGEAVTSPHRWSRRLPDKLASRRRDPRRVSTEAWFIGLKKKYP